MPREQPGPVAEFCLDLESFRAWRSRRPDGYVLTVTHEPGRPPLVIHRAACEGPLRTQEAAGAEGGGTPSPWVWACFDDLATLREWAREHLTLDPTPCPACGP